MMAGATDGPPPPPCTHPYVRTGKVTESGDICSTCGARVPPRVYTIEMRPVPDVAITRGERLTWKPPPCAPRQRKRP